MSAINFMLETCNGNALQLVTQKRRRKEELAISDFYKEIAKLKKSERLGYVAILTEERASTKRRTLIFYWSAQTGLVSLDSKGYYKHWIFDKEKVSL